MAQKFLSKKIIIPAIIFFGGLFIAAGVLFLPSILDIAPIAAGQIPQWTQQTGAGLSAPACASMASPPVTTTCNGGIAEATGENCHGVWNRVDGSVFLVPVAFRLDIRLWRVCFGAMI